MGVVVVTYRGNGKVLFKGFFLVKFINWIKGVLLAPCVLLLAKQSVFVATFSYRNQHFVS